MKIYADTSFLISLYSPDANSGSAVRVIGVRRGELLIGTFGELEFVNALQLRVFRKEISAGEAEAALKEFERDLRDGVFQLRAVSDQVYERARQLARQTTTRMGTRTADLLHLAMALELGVDYLYTFDQQQRRLAHSLHLKLNS